jgi:hypothetical protein
MAAMSLEKLLARVGKRAQFEPQDRVVQQATKRGLSAGPARRCPPAPVRAGQDGEAGPLGRWQSRCCEVHTRARPCSARDAEGACCRDCISELMQ